MTTLTMPVHSSDTTSLHTSSATTAVRPLRVGAVSYLNSKPLIEGLDTLLGTPCGKSSAGHLACQHASDHCVDVCRVGGELVLDYPSRLADQLAAGELDVALIPSVEAITGPGYQILSNACVAACGPVRSVKLYSRVPIGEIRSLALDEGSRTSAALTRTILSEQYGVEPELLPFPLGLSLDRCDADAVLMIGDRAMHTPSESFAATLDLGEHWRQWTGRPFVFAVWVARPGVEVAHVGPILSAARDRGLASLPEIAARDAAAVEITPTSAETYLRRNLHFTFGSAEQASLRFFEKLARRAGVI